MNGVATQHSIPRKNIIIVLVAVTVNALLFVVLAYAISKTIDLSSHVSNHSLNTWTIVGVVMSLYTLTTPWRWQKRIVLQANQSNRSPRQLWGMLALFCYAPLIAPLLYGLVLLFMGLPFAEFCYFAASALVVALAWSLYNLRANSPRQA